MRRHAVAAVAVVLASVLVPPSITGAQARAKREGKERSADLLRRASPAARASAARADAAAEAAGLAATGDPVSFGRSMRYLGLAQTLQVELLPDCTATSPEWERCLTPAPAPETTTFEFSDLARIDLPAKATSSLLCFSLTPFVNFEFWNGSEFPQWGAEFQARADITVESPVLADPALVDPDTGEPFGGKLVVVLGTYGESRSLAPFEYAYKRLTLSRNCVGGLLSKDALMVLYALTDEQATEFFKQPITLRFGASGYASFVSYANYFYGIRLYGD